MVSYGGSRQLQARRSLHFCPRAQGEEKEEALAGILATRISRPNMVELSNVSILRNKLSLSLLVPASQLLLPATAGISHAGNQG